MSLVTEIESLFQDLRTKVGGFTSDAELHFTNFLHLARSEEAAAEARGGPVASAPAPAAAPASAPAAPGPEALPEAESDTSAT